MNYASLRAEAGKPVLHKIVFDILSADILFFDVTYPNLNVFFELGIAYAANQNVFLIRPRGINDLPSDLAGLTYCTYDFNTELTFDWRAETDIKAAFKKTIQMKINLHS